MHRSRVRARALLPVVALALLAPLTGCEDGPAAPAAEPEQPARTAPVGRDESLREEALALVETREEALAAGDRGAFLATIDPDDLGFSSTQARWFDNLAQLPVTDVSFDLGDPELVKRARRDGDLQLPVDVTMRLRGFDQRPVTRRTVWTFVRRDGEVLLASDHDPRVDRRTGWLPTPWDEGHIEVRRSGGILAIFDEDTLDHADYAMSDLAAAARVVEQHLPWWSGRFVAYATSDDTALYLMSDMGVANTAGVAFPIMARPDGPVAAYRFLLNPDVVRDVRSRGLVFRHEMVHVALGTADDRSPVWLAEGAAEYVARSPLPLDVRRRFAAAQLSGVREARLVTDREFYRRDPAVNYELAALVCDFIASTRGEQALWDLVRAFEAAGTGTDGFDAVVRAGLGLSTGELGAAALAWARSA